MATRTGHQWLDAALEQFIEANPSLDPDDDYGFANYFLSHTDPEMHLRTDGSFDHTRIERWCILAAQQLACFLEEQGIEAQTVTIHDDFNPFHLNGYAERQHSNPEIPGHMVVQVWGDDDDELFMIDFTAGQYGYREWPRIQRCIDQGEWQEQWLPLGPLDALPSPTTPNSPQSSTLDQQR